MPPRFKGASRDKSKDLSGLLLLGIGVFLILCFLSYDAFDPSFHSLAPGRAVKNLGGVIGSYLTDLLLTLFGYAAYVIPAVLIVIALIQFSEKAISLTWKRLGGISLLTLLASAASHLLFPSIGEKGIDAGGLIGWGIGGLILSFLGHSGAVLFLTGGLIAALVWLTDLSVVRLGVIAFSLARFLGSRLQTLSVLLSVRLRKVAGQFWGKMTGPQGKQVQRPMITRPVPTGQAPIVTAMEKLEEKVVEKPPEKGGSLEKTIDRAVPGPKILPRVDLKEKKREQLELIQPVIAPSAYQLPPLTFLGSDAQERVKIDEESLKLNSNLLEKKLLDYGVEGRITEIHPGPIITMYEFEPAAGVKVNKIVNLEDDLALTMGGKSVRIIAPLPGKPAVGIEIPNNTRETVWLKEIIGHARFQRSESRLTLALGKDTEGFPFVSDLAKMPHLLVAGATGSGKSVSINSMILSLLYKATPEEVRLLMIDLKMLELSVYEGIPHLLLPVVTNPRRAATALHWAVKEMERRYETLAEKGSRNITSYNKSVETKDRLPSIVIIIDELADLMMTTTHEVERLITRLAQMARAAGIHLILATQRPSVDVLTGLIKANFPARISFKVSSKHDSRTIIDTVGSEHLLGSGDMLFMSGGTSRLIRVHGAYVTEEEILKVVGHCKGQAQPKYLEEEVLAILEPKEEGEGGGAEGNDLADEMYDQAVSLVAETRQASISMIQRRLRIGYNRAARMVERMEREGVVGPADGAKPREVFAQPLGSLEP